MSEVRIVALTASRDHACGSPWTCDGVKAGTRAAYVGGVEGGRPTPWCPECVDALKAGEPTPAQAEAVIASAAEDDTPAAAEPTSDEPCGCADRSDGFTDRGDGVFVHARCRRPAALPKTAAWGEEGSGDAAARTPAHNRALTELGEATVALAEPTPDPEPNLGDPKSTSRSETAGPAPEACPDCGAPILWTRSRNGRRMPVDAEPHAEGNIRVEPNGSAGVLTKGDLDEARATGGELRRHHRLTCGKADQWAVKAAAPAVDEAAVAADPPALEDQAAEQPAADGPCDCPTNADGSLQTTYLPRDGMWIHVQCGRPSGAFAPLRPEQPVDAGLQRERDEIEAWVAHGSVVVDAPHADMAALATAACRAAQNAPAAPAPSGGADPPAPPAQAGSDATGPADKAIPEQLADLTLWQVEAHQWGGDPEKVAADIVDAVRRGILAGDIRGRQVEIGPSEVGHPCARALAYRLAGVPHTGVEPTPWRQRIGTLVHGDNDIHLDRDNVEREASGLNPRWLTNLFVNVGELYPGREITGHLDVFDVLTGTVVDEKVPGSTAMRTYAPGKPESDQYRKQVQLYGRGCQRGGYRPAWVAVLRLSPARELSQYVYKFERYDETVAVDALSRAGGIARMVDQLGARAAAVLPPTDHVCHRCPWFRPNSPELTTGCPGAPGAAQITGRASVDDLVA